MQVGIHKAKTTLSRLIPAAQSGEDIIITKGGKPVARLIPYSEPRGKRQLGLFREKIIICGDLLEPLPDEMVADFWPGQQGK